MTIAHNVFRLGDRRHSMLFIKNYYFSLKHQNFPMKKVAVVLEAMLWCRYF
jgi:hypothetical protein